jgi:UDP-N-acetylmuramoylalanine--D-glutamate ligase
VGDGLDVTLDLTSRRVCVAGLGVAGESLVRVLSDRAAEVVTADRRDGTDLVLPDGVDLVVVSPGWRPDQPLLAAAAAAGVPVWGDVELAWRLRPRWQEWIGVTGTNGKTTTAQMTESILRAAGVRAVACGNIGLPAVDAAVDPDLDVLVVEMSSFQLHWTSSVDFIASAILNIAPDHVDWHGSFEAYAAAKAKIWDRVMYAIHNADDPVVARLARQQEDTQGFTLGPPDGRGCLGIDDDALVDRCFGAGVELARVADVVPAAPHNLANALAAAGLARAFGNGATPFEVPAEAVRDGLRAFRPGGHRIAAVATVDDVDYVDDSKATNPHAAAASVRAFGSVVWIAGGLAKGAQFDDLVREVAPRLRGVVLMGRDRHLVGAALSRHAPQIPVVDVPDTDTGAMDVVVRAAASLAQRDDTVLLAPACASMDMFRDYAARGDAFADAVRRLVR